MTKETVRAVGRDERPGGTPPLRGGLPEDAALAAFGIDSDMALAAFGPSARSSPSAEEEAMGPREAGGAEAASVSASAASVQAAPAPRAARPVVVTPDAVPVARIEIAHTGADASRLPTQCTIMVQAQVRDRFGKYQTAQKVETGLEPTNAVVVKRAFLHANRNDLWPQLREAVRHRQQPISEEDHDPDGLFGEVPARRVDRGGVKHGVQQSFRPSLQELAVYDAYAEAYSFNNRSDLLDAVLDAFLPSLPAVRRAMR
ncbi:hypothetical protein [Streptomyces fuscichromogenes]|uniref:Uncharacterized protein n=1 Tax=Streptomyces fuscichromogenes TaxID=1324013 RepID=A0A917XQ64_9ACTN|nr:hypothetical protein [Streptomyces fuscichromogenes]GGN46350.1 hypothetical protein GCM10011578_099190 [Streptomyces fuscichromogenes]